MLDEVWESERYSRLFYVRGLEKYFSHGQYCPLPVFGDQQS